MPDKRAFLYLDAGPDVSPSAHAVAVPYPTAGSAAFETARMVDAARNANGEMVGRLVGRSSDKQTLGWHRIACADWWAMHRWFEDGHFTFYCHYFDHNTGIWRTRLFYLGDVRANPVHVDEATGVPAWYEDASFSVIDCGVV